MVKTTLTIGLCIAFALNGISQVTPHETVKLMGRGINIGNTLEPPTEGGWNNGPVQEYYFDDYNDAGFTNVRIPITWDKHTSETGPYTIDSLWMDRVEQIVDLGVKQGPVHCYQRTS